ncbi:MAG: acyl-CoA thioesterase [Alphaproteobacteria bacterium]|uniref:Acyl-CoA thioester hydrolase n=1 Tax=Pseudorhizobium pelagicum TaxID=1509405 RepID=A0A922NXR1_9HYPH|nr:acyl-CoA thioesterase [Pseudorhizobium pelagicum]MBU1315682.1 acyl-CoA thioesterase [Alphaproteobacteria bacterium]KEQ02512.1 acyl-CoA thioester hydrolase [Pseudorhizobium pelagicum]KEQ02537.1 acyl-CoA thioester hydrolase [Pseudorhizobium pelagicum]MBU1551013.1 acyl-CoA thioesterase [Alphaproteobacteria bacterium]MBU2339149.1 acyl-CoA thioesterase [Alphaproteobacteria bacterium]|tara:strand:+ start:689 stop:1081 length:393 start_codon:yes stop_codon:yes gene_type:complete
MTEHPRPTGELTLRTLAMPSDANPAGDIFGGWVMSQMDLASGIRAAERARGRVVTAAVKEMAFRLPVKIGDTLNVYTEITRVGRSSIALQVEAWAQRARYRTLEMVTAATFIMVALDDDGHSMPVPPEED